MLVLSVTTGLRLILPSGEVIRIVNTEPQRRARLGIEAPKEVKIVRDGMKYSEEQVVPLLPPKSTAVVKVKFRDVGEMKPYLFEDDK